MSLGLDSDYSKLYVIFSVPPGIFLNFSHDCFLPHFFQFSYNHPIRSRDSVVDVATRCGLEDPGFEFLKGQNTFLSPNRWDRLWSSPTLLFNGYRDYFPGVRRTRREVDRSPPLVPRSRMTGAPPTRLHGVDRNSVTCHYLTLQSLDAIQTPSYRQRR